MKLNRIVNGVLFLDKPKGISSNRVLQKIRCLFNAKKAGYIGTLDPLATGILPICFGEATKFSNFLFNSDKRYYVIALLGKRTNTLDSEGEIVSERLVKINKNQLEDALEKFRGVLVQTPPMYSAVKFFGKPLYKYAREKITIKKIGRLVHIYELRLKFWEKDQLGLEIYCSKGTYIRKIIDDLGEILGCGAHVIFLRRLQLANYLIEDTISFKILNKFKDQSGKEKIFHQLDSFLYPICTILSNFLEINIPYKIANIFRKGQAISYCTSNISIGTKVRVTVGDFHEFIGIAKINEKNKIVPIRLISEN